MGARVLIKRGNPPGPDSKPPTSSTSSSSSSPWNVKVKKCVVALLKGILMALCFIVYLGIIPIFFAFMTPLYLYRFLVILAQKIFKPDWVGMMNTRDALVGLDKTTGNCECMITLLLVMKGSPNVNFIREVFQKQVIEGRNANGDLCYLKLKYYFESWLGFTFWKNEQDFSLDSHVREFEVPKEELNNNSDFVTEQQLLKALGPLATQAFGKGVSPWEALVVKNYKKAGNSHLHKDFKQTVHIAPVPSKSEVDEEYAIILRIHHAIADGYSIMQLLLSNICSDPLSVVPKAPVRKISTFQKFGKYAAIIALTPYYHFLQFFLNVDRTIWHLQSHKLTKQWQFTMTERISFSGVRETSKRLNVCVTATLVAALAGGIHNYFRRKGKTHLNKNLMRGLSPMPWKGHPNEKLVNHWTVGIMEIPVQEPCIRKRLLTAHKSAEFLKRSPILVTNFITVPVLLGAPNWLTNFWGTNWMTTMIISNFPGPNFPGCAFYNTQYIEDVMSWVPHMRGSAGLGVMFLSYNGGVRVSLSVDKAIIDNAEELDELAHLIAQEFHNLRSLPSVDQHQQQHQRKKLESLV